MKLVSKMIRWSSDVLRLSKGNPEHVRLTGEAMVQIEGYALAPGAGAGIETTNF